MSVVGLDIGSQTSFCGVARQGKIRSGINNIDNFIGIMGWAKHPYIFSYTCEGVAIVEKVTIYFRNFEPENYWNLFLSKNSRLIILISNILGGIEVVANEYSKRATETVVSLGDKMRHLGTAGNEKRISQIKATATNFKRLIGLPWEHHVVQSMASGTFAAPYKLIKCNETGGAAVQLPDGNVYAIQQVMAMFLGKMKEIAEGWFQNKLFNNENYMSQNSRSHSTGNFDQ